MGFGLLEDELLGFLDTALDFGEPVPVCAIEMVVGPVLPEL